MVIGIIFGLWLIIYIALRTPPVQRFVTGKIAQQLEKQIGTPVSLEGIDIEWLNGIELYGLYLEDQQQDTLLYLGKIQVNFEPWALLNKTLVVRLIDVRDTYINIYEVPGKDSLNFAYIPEAFASADTTTQVDTTSSSFTIEARQLHLSNIRVDFEADSTEAHVALGDLSLLLETLGLTEEHIQAEELAIDELSVALQLPRNSAPDSTTAQLEEPTPDSLKNVINPSGYAFSLADFSLANSTIDYQVGGQNQTDSMRQMNFENLLVANLGIQISDVEVGRSNASLNLDQFTFAEQRSGFELQEFALEANVDMPQVQASLQQLKTGHSNLNGTVDVGLVLEESMADLISSLNFQSRIERAELSLIDAGYFVDVLDTMPALKNSEINLWWDANIADGAGSIEDLQLQLDDRFALQGNLKLQDLANVDSTVAGSPYMDLRIDPIQTNLSFFRQLLGDNAGLPRLARDTLILQASAEGRLEDIEGNIALNTSVGKLLAGGRYQQTSSGGMDIRASVEGQRLQVKQLLLAMGQDTLAQDFGTLSFHARTSALQTVTPYDTTFSEAKWDLLVDQIDYKGYRYNEWQIEGYLADEQLVTQVNYQDSLLDLDADANLDMREPTLAYGLDLQLPIANLYRLNLSSDSVILQNVILTADLKGTDPDSIVGEVKISPANVIKDAENYLLDSLVLTADRNGSERKITLVSDYISALISGEFSVNELPKAIEDFQQYYFTAYQAPSINQDTVNTSEAGGQKIHFELDISETPLVARALVPDLSIPEALSFGADFNSADKSLRASLSAPHIDYGTNVIDSLYLNVITTERQINIDLLSHYVQAGGLSIPQVLLAGKLSGVPDENQAPGRKRLATTELDFNLKMGEDDAPYRLDLNTRVRSQGDTVTVMVDDSEVILDSLGWDVSNRGRIKYAQNFLDIDQFFLKQGDQELYISTNNDDNSSNLKVAVEQFEIGPFLNSIDLESYNIQGIFYGDATIQDMFQPGPIQADFNIASLHIRDSLVGDFNLQAKKGGSADDQADLLDILSSLTGPRGNLKIDGTYNLSSEATNPINLHLALDDFLLDPWKTFLEGQMNEFSGKLFASLDITGSPTKPDIEGNIRFGEQVILEPTVSSARYYIEDQRLDFAGDEVRLNEFTLLDSARTPAVLSGTISYADLTNPSLDLSFETNEFIFVNSYDYENEAFFGKAVASADATIQGPVSDMVIDGSMSVNEGTNMTISLISDPAEAQMAGFVEFVEGNEFIKADTATQDSLTVVGQAKDTISISGFTLNTNITLNPEAQFTIIVDPVRGDRVVVAGEADLQVNMQPNGDLTLQGLYTINRGSYLLNFAQVVKKEFTLREGSTITWSGDPANADLDLTAAYEVETSLEELFQDLVRNGDTDPGFRNLISTERPVFVELIIEGEISDPQLRFDLGLPEITAGGIYSDLVNERLEQVEQDETQLYKQVFGLIVLNRFIPISGGLGFGGGGSGYASVNDQINSSVSQLLTDQLGQLTEDYLGGVELNVDLASSDQDQSQGSLLADRDVNVGLSKELFNDRLTVKVGGMTSTGNQGATQDNKIYGDFEVLYRITETGNLKLRIFQSNDRDRITNQIRQRQGASMLYQKSFDRLFEEDVLRSKPLPEEEEEEDSQKKDQNATIQNDSRRRKGQGN